MANEELTQRGYLASGKLKGIPFGEFEELNIGSTSVKELVNCGVKITVPNTITYPFTEYSPPKKPQNAKPDRVFLRRDGNVLRAVAVAENKAPAKNKPIIASEQAYFSAIALGVPVAIITNGTNYLYLDVNSTTQEKKLIYFDEKRAFNPAVLSNLLNGDKGQIKDPKPLAESVWQIIWHATKAEPKECLLTFVEIFVLKFLSDNLPEIVLPRAYSFYELTVDPADFAKRHGKSAIEYYVEHIRPRIKTIFPDNVIVKDSEISSLFGLQTLVSKTSIINGFAFLRSSETSIASFNRTFIEILQAFQTFGPLTAIDPEFKLRLYETFLRRSARQQRFGQFFTPRNIVRSMIRMARLNSLPEKAILLDPAAGVGGFVLEPMLFSDALPNNIYFVNGKPKRRIKTIGVDVDINLHILGKANMLIHLAEALRDPSTTMSGLNDILAETFILMNSNETLGSLENPPYNSVDVILTNPPYVTQGSAIYKKEIAEIEGTKNGIDLRDYYDGCGLGVESLFLKYISGALKPGAKAFMIVPLGMLNRTEVGPKQKLLNECNIIASIQLPRNAFFNTSQKTYILVLEKRFTIEDKRPDVFCGIARTIGETLDWKRIPTPNNNDLETIANSFVSWMDSNCNMYSDKPIIKIISSNEFRSDDRWDILRFWSDEELVELGQKESPIERISFIDETKDNLIELSKELENARIEISALNTTVTKKVCLGNKDYFFVRSGTRITSENIRKNPGTIPVYSCFKNDKITKGNISDEWLRQNKIEIENKTLVTINANGASVGKVYVRDQECVLTDDVIIIDILHSKINPEYLALQLRSAIAAGGFLYEAKLFAKRVEELEVDLPIMINGEFDIQQQNIISMAIKRFDNIRLRLVELGEASKNARII
jgi:type I restriction enzyme M protein